MKDYPKLDDIVDWEEHRLNTCRLRGVTFSTLEDPTHVTLDVSEHALALITEILGKSPKVVGLAQFGGGRTIELRIDDVYTVRQVSGKTRGVDADYVIKSPLYDMGQMIYCMFEEW